MKKVGDLSFWGLPNALLSLAQQMASAHSVTQLRAQSDIQQYAFLDDFWISFPSQLRHIASLRPCAVWHLPAFSGKFNICIELLVSQKSSRST